MSSTCCCCAIVQTTNQSVLERWGRFSSVIGPGMHCYIPCVYNVAGTLSTKTQQLGLTTETKTQDNVFVHLNIAVQYNIQAGDVETAFYSLMNPHEQMKAYIEDSVRGIVPRLTLDKLFETKTEIGDAVNQHLAAEMKQYGFLIFKTLVTDIIPDQKVKYAMNAINTNRRLREAAVEKAEGEKIALVKAAEAEAESKHLQGVGVARQREAIIDGYKKSISDFSGSLGIKSEEAMIMTLTTQYFDMLRDVGTARGARTTFLPSGHHDVTASFRDALLQSKTPYKEE